VSAQPPPPRPSRLRRLATRGGLLLLAAVGTFVWLDREFLFDRFDVVEAGRLYRSSHLPGESLDRYVEEHGIRTVVNLMEDVPSDRAVAEKRGIRYVDDHCNQVPTQAAVDRFLEVKDDPTAWPVLVHCEHGVGRTGVMAAIYRMEYDGWPAEKAIAEARRFAHWGSFYEGQDKTEFLKAYVPRRRRAAAATGAGAAPPR
jgi:hypothetical protein